MITVYDKKTPKDSFANNGLCILDECIKAEITNELNSDYSLEVEYPLCSKKAEFLKRFNIIKADNQLFRIYKIEKSNTSISTLKIWARHISYDLSYFFIEEELLQAGSSVLDVINIIKEGTPFSISTDIDYSFEYPVNFTEINNLEALFQMIKEYGGELYRDNFTIKLNYQIGVNNGVLVRYGKNIKGIVETLNMDSVVTRLYPIGADNIRLPERYIDSAFISHSDYPPYPIIKKLSFDVYDEWTLRIVAEEHLREIDKPKATYEVDFIELSKFNNFKEYKHLQQTNLGDLVKIKHSKLGIDIKLKIIKYEKDLLSGSKSKIVLGDLKENFMDFQLALKKSKDTVDYAFRKGKLNSATLKGLKIMNEELEKVTFEITEEGHVIISTDNAIVIDNEGIKIFDKTPSEVIRIGEYEPDKFGMKVKDIDSLSGVELGKYDTDSYGIKIVGKNNNLMLDEYGIDPRFIKPFKNMIWNSSFERFDTLTGIPHFWTGGVATSDTSFDNTISMRLGIGEMSEQVISKGNLNPRPNPSWWNNSSTRVSFVKKGGDIQVQIFSEYDFSPFNLIDEDGNTGSYYNTGYSDTWEDGRYTFTFDPNKSGRVWMRFSNIGDSEAYIDAVQMEPDFNGKYPSFYTNGSFSLSSDEIPLSNTWLEYINLPYERDSRVEFNQRYTLPPTINVNIIRNLNTENVGEEFEAINMNANIDLIIENDSGYLYYTGAYIKWNGVEPLSTAELYTSVQIVGRL